MLIGGIILGFLIGVVTTGLYLQWKLSSHMGNLQKQMSELDKLSKESLDDDEE